MNSRTRLYLPFILVGLFSINCFAILNGDESAVERHPYVEVFTADHGSTGPRCTGVFLAPSVMLTASHCFVGVLSQNFNHRIYIRGSERFAKVYYDHDVNKNLYFEAPTKKELALDLALVVFSDYKNKSTRPYPKIHMDKIDIQQLNTPGTFETVGMGPSNVKKKLESISMAKIRSLNANLNDYLEGGILLLRSADEDRSTCVGDSGGPIFHEGLLVGINSSRALLKEKRKGETPVKSEKKKNENERQKTPATACSKRQSIFYAVDLRTYATSIHNILEAETKGHDHSEMTLYRDRE